MMQHADHLSLHPDPAKIVVPRKHGQLLIEPALGRLVGAVASGAAAGVYASGAEVFGESLAGLRLTARKQLLGAVREWSGEIGNPLALPSAESAVPVVLTGHQVEFYHAGVWAKVLVADEVAKRAGGIAIDVLMDHDVIEECGFDVPVQRGGEGWERRAMTFAEASAVPADSLSAPDGAAFGEWDARLAGLAQSHTDSLAFFMTALKPTAGGDVSYTAWLSRARSRFEGSFDLAVHHVPTGLLCSGPLWRRFVGAWIEHAEGWTGRYNAHLAAYRAAEGIKNPQHPMPDLGRVGGGGEAFIYELPFWIYKGGEARRRLSVKEGAAGTILLAGEEELPLAVLDDAASPYRIRPRALTLTMYLRLFFADLFIHGIGGALYDQITDRLLEDLFGIVPPYGCVSAAWLLPLGQPLENSDLLPVLKSRRHHTLHNPQLAIDPFTALKTDVAERIRDRRELVGRIAESLAQARRDPVARAERASWFKQLHEVNAQLHGFAPRLLQNLDRQIQEALVAQEQGKVLLWREYFFALHMRASLQMLIDAVRRSAG